MSDTPTRRRAITGILEEGKPISGDQRFALAQILRVLGMYREGRFEKAPDSAVLAQLSADYDKLIALEVPRV